MITTKQDPRGFTLIEMVVVIGLTSLIIVALGFLLVFFYRTNTYIYQQTAATVQARQAIDGVVHDVREARHDATSAYPIRAAATSTLSFSADVNNNLVLEYVTYTLTQGTLYRAVSSGTTSTTTLASSLANSTSTPLFRYFDASGVELSSPVDVSRVVSIVVTAVVESTSELGITSFTLSGRATLRNNQL
ncbi:hypothetical protein COU19_03505 [Candidatus Kaiserbacteria bacterium CG10_big_fil_rev_8_21_14_0_10_56_12]|uniref:Prepilin-type N-terminal cleavage/methylation domain-containing protein n=1 Tax=Candidatus Kaiserbacteria bacterium CG10_big_fil_rev_8_21_14_0_10_56_12 TaxID=1974611 RepID=A0A2H0U903_9BACT|nr:MAG: hypothetical protein COU19_03505 [Candidatus Kaiserbacteria bacterium CG10_big_fil_rev_8_21_14_0_10_56_12]